MSHSAVLIAPAQRERNKSKFPKARQQLQTLLTTACEAKIRACVSSLKDFRGERGESTETGHIKKVREAIDNGVRDEQKLRLTNSTLSEATTLLAQLQAHRPTATATVRQGSLVEAEIDGDHCFVYLATRSPFKAGDFELDGKELIICCGSEAQSDPCPMYAELIGRAVNDVINVPMQDGRGRNLNDFTVVKILSIC